MTKSNVYFYGTSVKSQKAARPVFPVFSRKIIFFYFHILDIQVTSKSVGSAYPLCCFPTTTKHFYSVPPPAASVSAAAATFTTQNWQDDWSFQSSATIVWGSASFWSKLPGESCSTNSCTEATEVAVQRLSNSTQLRSNFWNLLRQATRWWWGHGHLW